MSTTLEGAILSHLMNDTNVSAIVGTRIHPFNDPQTIVLPKVTYQRTGTNRTADIGGISNDGPTGAAVARMQLDCLAVDLLTAKQLATAVRKSLHGLHGTTSGQVIGCITCDDEREMEVPVYPGQEKPVQRQVLIFSILYSDAI